ncbi:RND multidrug efflux transporter, Acriflavin resistance protein [Klebsiella pneumoniae]|uniref:RND multidrug efflux transporter, Acriflavin resistance protein n=1 Tax=Klebsiella pneumoniae TaxID=573 RepID=A0A2X3BY12_KLEPN|nr:RND multidrug efflux transporter, Acriflavin resistance protein [Klebsiella pneumoniae]
MIATTLVLLAVFVPVALLPGIVGELYRQFAVTLSTAVALSSLVALTLTPALCALLLRPRPPGRRRCGGRLTVFSTAPATAMGGWSAG